MAMGEAAGTAAAMAASEGADGSHDVATVDVAALQDELRDASAILPG
jgi:hypothetical protein